MKKNVRELAVAQMNGEVLEYVKIENFKNTRTKLKFETNGCTIIILKRNIVGYSIMY